MTKRLVIPLTFALLLLVGLWIGATAFSPPAESQISEPVSLDGPREQVIFALAPDPANPGEIYAGVWGDGVYRSDNGGQTWAARDAGLQSRAREVLAVVRAAQGNKSLYIGTAGQGVYRSDDGGKTWVSVSKLISPEWAPASIITNPLYVNAVLVTDAAGETVYAGTRYGIRKSVNGGKTWEVANSGLENESALYAQALAYDQRNDVLYAGTWGDGVYRSQDSGKTWQATRLAAQGVLTVASLLVDPHSGILYAGGASGLGVYRSDDGGATWQERNNGIDADWRARTVQALAMDASGALYAGTVDYGVFKSADGGATWQSKSKGLKGFGLSILTLSVAADGKTLYAGTFGGGIYRSRDEGETWETCNTGIPEGALTVQALAVRGFPARALYAGTSFGVYVRMDGSTSWSRRVNGLPIGKARSIQALDVSETNTVTLYAGTQDGLYRAVDDGGNFTWTRQTVVPASPAVPVTFIIHRENAFYLAVGGDRPGIYRSRDDGGTWQAITSGLSLEGLRAGINRDSAISLRLGEGSTIYAALFGKGVYVSRDAGEHWEPLSDSPRYPQGLDVTHKDVVQWALWAGPRATLYAQALEGLYSRESGKGWALRFPGAVGALLADSFHPGIVYAGTLTSTTPLSSASEQASAVFGVILSQDDGQTWKLAQKTISPVTALAQDQQEPTTLYIGTLNRGVYQSQLSLPSIWQRSDTAIRLGIVFLLLSLLFDLMAFSYEFRVLPWKAAWALTSPISLSRLLVEPSPLTQLQRLILAFWPGGEARPEDVQKALAREQAPTSWTQLTAALDDLRQHSLLVKGAGGAFRVQRSALVSIANRQFAPRREILSKAVREESRVYQDAQEFFRQGGFLPRTTLGGLFLLSPRVVVDEGLYAGIFGASPITAQEIDSFLERVRDEYHGQIEGRRAYAVITAPPMAEAYRRLTDLATQSPHLQVIAISHAAIRRALAWNTAAAEMARSEARVTPEADLYALEGPAIDPLDFFGRQELLRDIETTLDQDSAVGLVSMPRIGKTSLLWQLKERLGNRPSIYVDLALLAGQPGDLARALSDALTAEALAWKFNWSPPDLVGIESATAESDRLIQMLDAYMAAMRSRLPEPRLLLLLDTVEASAVPAWNVLVRLARSDSGLQVVLAFDNRPEALNGHVRLMKVRPFSAKETAELAQILARPLGSTYQADALQRLNSETAGHPQLVRQLCSEIMTSGRGELGAITDAEVAKAAQRYLLDRPPLLNQIWEFMIPIEQSILLHLATPEAVLQRAQLVPPAQQALDELERLGIVSQQDSSYRIAAGLVRTWLNMTVSAALSLPAGSEVWTSRR